MGLLLESSGDSPDDDLEMFCDADECRKVRLIVFVSALRWKVNNSLLCRCKRETVSKWLMFIDIIHKPTRCCSGQIRSRSHDTRLFEMLLKG